MGILDAMRKHAENNVPDFVRCYDIFKYEGEYYYRRENYFSFHSDKDDVKIKLEKLNRHRCSTTCDEHQWTKMDVNKVKELTIDDYKKLANENWQERGRAMTQMCRNVIGCPLDSAYSICGKTIGPVTFISRDVDGSFHEEILVIHCGEVVAVERNYDMYSVWACKSLQFALYDAVMKFISWDFFIDGIYNDPNYIKKADVTSLNIKDAIDRWNIAQFKKSESTLQEALESLYTYQRNLNEILEKQEINTTPNISTYKEMIMFINSIQLYKNILKPEFNVSILKEACNQSQLVSWIEK